MNQINREASHEFPLNSFSGRLSKDRKRVGRGIGSRGRTCGAGDKGQCARSGTSAKRRHLEFARRFPKVGFKSGKIKPLSISLNDLISKVERRGLQKTEISIAELEKLGFSTKNGIKIIGKQEINFPLKIEAHYFTKGATESINGAGGAASVIGKKRE